METIYVKDTQASIKFNVTVVHNNRPVPCNVIFARLG